MKSEEVAKTEERSEPTRPGEDRIGKARNRDPNEREARSVALMRFGHDEAEFRQQQVTPRHALRTDLVLQLGDRVPCVWGPLAPLLVNRRTAVEFVSGHLDVDTARGHFAEALFHGEPGRPARECQLLTVCFGAPRARLREAGPGLQSGALPGIWTCDLAACGRWVVVAVDRLPVMAGTSVLRLTHLRPGLEATRAALDHLLTDPNIDPTIQRSILEDLRMNKIPTSHEERLLSNDEHWALARAEGERIGENRGEKRGQREAWLVMARLLLSPEQVARLELASNDELRAAVEAAARR